MAFKMKGSAFYGKGNQSPIKATGDPKKEKSESPTTNLLDKLAKYGSGKEGDPVKDKSDFVASQNEYRISDLPSMGADATREDEHPILHNPRNKDELAKREAAAKERVAKAEAQSMGDYVKQTSKAEAAKATSTRVKKEEDAAKDAKDAEQQRRNSLGEKGREKENKDIEKANKENNKALEKAAKKGGDKPVFKKKKKY